MAEGREGGAAGEAGGVTGRVQSGVVGLAAVVPYWPTVELPGWSTVMRDWAAVRLPVTEQVCVSHQM